MTLARRRRAAAGAIGLVADGPAHVPAQACGPHALRHRRPFPLQTLTPIPWRAGWCLAAGVAGTALQLQQAALWPLPVYQSLVLCGLLALWLRSRAAWAFAGLALAVGCTGWRAHAFQADGLDVALEGRDIAVVGRVASLPQAGATGLRFVFVVERAALAGVEVRLPPRLLLGWYRAASDETEPPDLRAGDRWALELRLKRPHGDANPSGFDRERWLWEQGIGATGSVRLGPRAAPPRRLGTTPWHPVDRARQAIAQAIAQRVGDPRSAGVIAALAVGDQAAIDRADWALYRDTATAHAMAISGAHVTLFAWLATVLIAALWRGIGRWWPALPMRWPASHAAAVGGVLAATAYALLAGGDVPAQRTVLMLALVVGLRVTVRQWPWPAVWLLAMAAVLVLDPWALLDAGFWLSFLAVALLFAADPGRPSPAGARSLPLWRRGGRAAARLWREQWLMTLGLAPLGLLLFGQFSLVGLLANLVAVPWVGFVVTPLALLGVLLHPLWSLAAWAVELLNALLQPMAAWPWAVVHRPAVPFSAALAAVAGGALLVMRLPGVMRLAGLLLMAPAGLYQPPRPPPGAFEVLAIDVGQGSAVLVRTARHALVYDSGPRWSPEADAGERTVLPLLRALGVQPDRVVISHRDSDHAGGADALRRAFPGAVWRSSFDDDPALRCRAGERWHWDGVDFELLHPDDATYARAGVPTNALSCVLRIAAGAQVAWLTGDVPAAQETRLALARPQERVALLLAPHHGSASSSSPVLLNTLRPRWVVVQAGYRNRYGHPAPAVLARYDARGLAWVDTPRCGAATWRSDEPEAMRCEREQAGRYWQHREPRPPVAAGPELAILLPGAQQP